MVLFLNKKKDELSPAEKPAAGQVARQTALPEFIPYDSHYDPNTLLTKNGELLQIIKIASNTRGLNYESGSQSEASVRENIRKAIKEAIITDRYSLWIHTLRKRKPIGYTGHFNEPLAAYASEKWQDKHHWRYQYYNEIYVSVLYEGHDSKLLDTKNLKHILLSRKNRAWRKAYLQEAFTALNGTVSAMLEKIRPYYSAHRLSVAERISSDPSFPQAVFYSEPMEFLGTLFNLRSEACLVTDENVSSALVVSAPTFGYNALETRDTQGKRRFAAILSLKRYVEVPPETVDRLLQAPIELTVSQCFSFARARVALKEYKEQKQLFTFSDDRYSAKVSGLEEMLRSNKGKPTDFVEHQTSIMVLSDEYKELDSEVLKVQTAFAELGLITIREDIKLEECFWAMLPGNFEFIRRKTVLNANRVGGLCRLNRFPNGINHNNHWGEAVTLIPTLVNSPYFFNFHKDDNGHTVLFDYNSFNDHAGTSLLNFLLASTRKYDGRLYVFDRKRVSELFFDKLEGHYHYCEPHSHSSGYQTDAQAMLKLCPFSLEDNKRNRSFLLAWSSALLAPAVALSETQKETLRQAIDQLYAGAPEDRHLKGFVERVSTLDPVLGSGFAAWHGAGRFAGLLDAETENLDMGQLLHAFDMDYATQHAECTIPLFSYLMHRIVTHLNGMPTIIVLHEAWDLVENGFFAPRLESLLEMLKQHNVMVLFTTSTPQDHARSQTLATLLKECGTRLYVPDEITIAYAGGELPLSEIEQKLMLRLDRQRGDFLLQQNNEAIPLRVNFDGMDDIRAIFSNDVKNLMAAGGRFASLPKRTREN